MGLVFYHHHHITLSPEDVAFIVYVTYSPFINFDTTFINFDTPEKQLPAENKFLYLGGRYQFPENYFPDSFPRKFLG